MLSAMGLLAASLCPSHAEIQSLKFDHISIEQGLSQSSVFSATQDSRGFLWFGTQDGLNRFDGHQFVVYSHHPEDENTLSDNNILCLLATENDLWIGTEGGGLNRLNLERDQIMRFRFHKDRPRGLPSDVVNDLLAESDERIWVATDNGLAVFHLPTGQFKTFRHHRDNPTSLSANQVTSLEMDDEGFIWVGTREGGLNRLDPATGRFRRFRHHPNQDNSLCNDQILHLARDKSGMIWVATQRGLSRLNPHNYFFLNFTHQPDTPNSLSDNTVHTVLEDSKGRLWVGTQNGLNYLDPTQQEFFRHYARVSAPKSLSESNVRMLFEDRSGLLWVGTANGGLNKFNSRHSEFQHIRLLPNTKNTLTNPVVWSILEDHLGFLWIATEKGLNRLDPQTDRYEHFLHDPKDPTSLSDDVVRVVLEDFRNQIWVGTELGGLNRFERENETFLRYGYDPENPKNPSGKSILCMTEDHQNRLWIGTKDGGLNRYDPNRDQFVPYTHDPNNPHSISDNSVYSLYADGNDTLWLGTLGGMNRLDMNTGRFEAFRYEPKNPNSLSNDGVGVIVPDLQGEIWIGTDRGLNLFHRDTNSFTRFTTEDGLPNNFIYGIMVDSAGLLWISTNRGLSRMDPLTRNFRNFDTLDGLQSNEFNTGAYASDRTGRFFFGGVNGISVFHPLLIQENNYVPPIVFTEFRVFDDPIKSSRKAGGLPVLHLSHNDNFFSFEYVALDYNIPQKNRYKYKLEGFDKSWNDVGNRRYGSYTNLRGGLYTLRVLGSNNDGVWNEEGTAVRLIVTPPPWLSIWAYAGYAGIGLFLIYITVRYKTRRQALILSETLRQITHDLSHTLDLDLVMNQLLDHLLRVVPYERATVFLEQENRFDPVVTRTREGSLICAPTYAMESQIIADLLEKEDTIFIGNTRDMFARMEGSGKLAIRTVLAIPIEVNHRIIGTVQLYHHLNEAFKRDTIDLAVTLVNQAGIAIENARLFSQVKRLATTDELTGIFNRRYFFELAEREFERASRYRKNLSLIMFDIDHFKRVNDTYGHQTGDSVIQFIAETILGQLRKSDLMARFGGEEFIVLLPETDPENARLVANRLHQSLRKRFTTRPPSNIPRVTASFGVVTIHDNVRDLEALIEEADRALYQAKAAGRDQVVVYEPREGSRIQVTNPN
ncbi:two-component regulator propeller domain-containing protein [Sulfidibacter corallicola]|uniref:diguanylate cyclase n=1 Tax=Sulfidibacter corallicola TaxID=2818388 RepID=A0A8A4TJ62_SULCO|nr:two-component regulator propeller domain-containing protein [Sulfidibacter corallicola]QTD49590.1 diguanylate cyclase [Sulfidibacter corallicola]